MEIIQSALVWIKLYINEFFSATKMDIDIDHVALFGSRLYKHRDQYR